MCECGCPVVFECGGHVVTCMRKVRIDQAFLIEHWHMIYIMPVVVAVFYF